jgi:hypothetical protein
MDMPPQVGWADVVTKHDLVAFEDRMNLRFELVDRQFDALEDRFELTEHKLLAAFRGEMLAQSNAIAGQMRTLLVANLASVVSVAAIVFGVTKLA